MARRLRRLLFEAGGAYCPMATCDQYGRSGWATGPVLGALVHKQKRKNSKIVFVVVSLGFRLKEGTSNNIYQMMFIGVSLRKSVAHPMLKISGPTPLDPCLGTARGDIRRSVIKMALASVFFCPLF